MLHRKLITKQNISEHNAYKAPPQTDSSYMIYLSNRDRNCIYKEILSWLSTAMLIIYHRIQATSKST